MSNDEQTAPDAYAEHPEESAFPAAGRRVSDEERQAALDAEPAGNATVGDTVDTDALDSTAHESGAGSDEVVEQVEGGHHDD
jgi:hypothetical protein